MDCTVAEHLIPRDRCLHSVLWNEIGDTSSVKGSLDTEEHPVNTEYNTQELLKEGNFCPEQQGVSIFTI